MKTIGLILQIVLLSSAILAQNQDTNLVKDTARVHSVIVIDPGIALGRMSLLLPPSLQPDARFAPLSFTEMPPGMRPPFLAGLYEPKADLMSPYLLQTRRDSKVSTIYTVIGAVELGGAAYIAYRHIKKYGFLH